MITQIILGLVLLANTYLPVSLANSVSAVVIEQKTLASHELDLTNRLPNSFGSEVFADNILFALHCLKSDVSSLKTNETINGPSDIDWDKTRSYFEVSFTLKPGEVFAYHANVLPAFNAVVKTMNSKFFIDEGYKSLAGLGGNGVCHLASLINWVASDAGLEVTSKVNHDFYPVPGVPREYGSSIFYAQSGGNSQNQNLYIKNNLQTPVTFDFKADNKLVTLKILGS
ncbi:MAG: VanW family protein [Patescibacteria group bacterium]